VRKSTQGQRESGELTDPKPRTFPALGHRDFRLYWGGQFVSTAGSQMQMAAVAWQVYLLTNSAVALGLIGLMRVVPIILLSIFGGVVADVLDRRRLLIITQSVLMSLSLLLSIATWSGHVSVWVIYTVTALAACAISFDNPARQAMIPSLVPRAHLTNAISVNSTTFQLATMIGPAIAGLIIATSGVAAVYATDAASFCAVLIALIVIRPPAIVGGIQRVSIGAAVEGLRFMRDSPIILWTMLLDFVATFCGSATALLPIFARQVLAVGSEGYGVLYAAPAGGAIVAGALMSIFGSRIRRQGITILVAVTAYGLCTVLFGLSRIYLISLLALAGTGAADTVSMVLRQTVRQLNTPDVLRGRMTSVGMMFFMGGPQLGEMEAGAVAGAVGAPLSVIFGGVAAIVATVIIATRAAGLCQYTGPPR
jgi:MFS family permease